MKNRHIFVITALLAAYLLVYRPAAARVAILRRVVPQEAEQLTQLRDIAASYSSRAAVLQRIRSGLDRRHLMAHLQKCAADNRIESGNLRIKLNDDRVDDIYSEATADAALTQVTMAELGQFVVATGTEPGVLLRSLKITGRSAKNANVDAELTFTSLFARSQ